MSQSLIFQASVVNVCDGAASASRCEALRSSADRSACRARSPSSGAGRRAPGGCSPSRSSPRPSTARGCSSRRRPGVFFRKVHDAVPARARSSPRTIGTAVRRSAWLGQASGHQVPTNFSRAAGGSGFGSAADAVSTSGCAGSERAVSDCPSTGLSGVGAGDAGSAAAAAGAARRQRSLPPRRRGGGGRRRRPGGLRLGRGGCDGRGGRRRLRRGRSRGRRRRLDGLWLGRGGRDRLRRGLRRGTAFRYGRRCRRGDFGRRRALLRGHPPLRVVRRRGDDLHVLALRRRPVRPRPQRRDGKDRQDAGGEHGGAPKSARRGFRLSVRLASRRLLRCLRPCRRLRLDLRCEGLALDHIRLRRGRYGGGAFLETVGKAVPHRGDLAPLVGFLLVVRGAFGLRPARLGAGPIVAGIFVVARLHQPDHSRCAPDRAPRTPAIFKSATEPSTVNGVRGAHEPRLPVVFSGFLFPWTPCG